MKAPHPAVDLSVIVPAYNEARRIPKTLRRINEYLLARPFTSEVLVVLDGSTDDTREVLQPLCAEIVNLKILDRRVNRGKGYTVREGVRSATGRVRLFMDADNSTDIAQFDLMRPMFEKGCDLVIASRSAKDSPGAQQTVSQPFYRRALGTFGNLFVQLVAVRGIWDTQCGFKAFRAEVAEEIFSRTTIDGWGFDIEVLALACALKYRLGIIPAQWVNDARSHFRAPDYLRIVVEAVKVRHHLATCKYNLDNN